MTSLQQCARWGWCLQPALCEANVVCWHRLVGGGHGQVIELWFVAIRATMRIRSLLSRRQPLGPRVRKDDDVLSRVRARARVRAGHVVRSGVA